MGTLLPAAGPQEQAENKTRGPEARNSEPFHLRVSKPKKKNKNKQDQSTTLPNPPNTTLTA